MLYCGRRGPYYLLELVHCPGFFILLCFFSSVRLSVLMNLSSIFTLFPPSATSLINQCMFICQLPRPISLNAP